MSRSGAADREDKTPRPEAWGRWLLLALALSLGIHYALYRFSLGFPVHIFSEAYYDQLVPRAFKVDRVEIDAKLLEETPDEPAAKRSPDAVVKPLPLPEEDIALEASEVRAAPAPPKPLPVDDAPKLAADAAVALEGLDRAGGAALEEDLQSLRESLLRDEPGTRASSGPAVSLPEAARAVPAGYSDLDTLLASAGGLTGGSAPIFMPADLLFGYDESVLGPGAISSLEKLGRLIQRNPAARFRIEGHTDGFGGADYNLRLSTARAASVKAWLAGQMGIDPARIDIVGLGSTRPLAPLDGTIEAQQLNRRVEIVILKGGESP